MKKQKEILSYLQKVESATIDDINKNVKFSYYHNANKYIGEILSRMVKTRMVERIKPGVFRIKQREPLPIQNSLF